MVDVLLLSPTTRRNHCWWYTEAKALVRRTPVKCPWKLTNELYAAYDVKLIMKNGTIDIVRPEWVKRCVSKGELVPLKKKYVSLSSTRS